MSKQHLHPLWSLLSLLPVPLGLLLGSSCAIADAELSSADTVEVGEIEDDELAMTRLASAPEDPPRTLVARLPDLTVELAPLVEVASEPSGPALRASGHTSVDLAEVRGWVPDDAYAQVELTGPRSFVITLRDPSEQNTMLSGMPLFVTLIPVSGAPAEAAVWFRPRLTAAPARGGNGRLRFYAAVKPVWVAGDVMYRGRLAVESGWTASIVSSPAPLAVPLPAGKLRLDWGFDGVRSALAGWPALLRARAVRGPVTVERTAALQVRVLRLGLTRLDPRDVWPSACDPRVRACLAQLPQGQLDTEPCGSYRQVLACGGPAGARAQP